MHFRISVFFPVQHVEIETTNAHAVPVFRAAMLPLQPLNPFLLTTQRKLVVVQLDESVGVIITRKEGGNTFLSAEQVLLTHSNARSARSRPRTRYEDGLRGFKRGRDRCEERDEGSAGDRCAKASSSAVLETASSRGRWRVGSHGSLASSQNKEHAKSRHKGGAHKQC